MFPAMQSTTSGRKRVTFEVSAEPGSEVSVAGTFNDWDPARNLMHDRTGQGAFRTSMLLHPGRYEYKFVINNVWSIDPECRNWAPNAEGSLNSVLLVG